MRTQPPSRLPASRPNVARGGGARLHAHALGSAPVHHARAAQRMHAVGADRALMAGRNPCAHTHPHTHTHTWMHMPDARVHAPSQETAPAVCLHLLRLDVNPGKVALPWMFSGFASFLPAEQVLATCASPAPHLHRLAPTLPVPPPTSRRLALSSP